MAEAVKEHVRELLRKQDYSALTVLCEKDRRYWQAVRFRLYDLDEMLRWPAIETAGQFMRLWWLEGREEKVRIYIRTLFWSMTDESGGIGWSSPQTIAEIISNIPVLIDPYGNMMIAHSVDEPPLVKGCLWGIGRLGRLITDSVNLFKDKILEVFRIEDPETLGLASWALGEAGFTRALPFLEKLILRTEHVKIYINGEFMGKPLGNWAGEAVLKMNKAS